MRTSATACLLSALAALVGGWLVARWCLGLVLIAEAACGFAWGLLRDDGTRAVPRALSPGRTLAEIFDRARSEP